MVDPQTRPTPSKTRCCDRPRPRVSHHPRRLPARSADAARNIRAWVGRQNKPQYAGYVSNTVDFVTGLLDTLDLVLLRATQSVDHHMPHTAHNSGPPNSH